MEKDINLIYGDVIKLLEGDHPECSSAPYKYKYEAREKLDDIKSKICGELDKRNTDHQSQIDPLNIKYAAITIHLGIIGLDTEELSTGQENFEKALKLLDGVELNEDCISITILCLNKLAILWSHRDEQEKSCEYLTNARSLYISYRGQETVSPPKSIHEIFLLKNASLPSGWEDLEKLHTLTLYYLAQVEQKLGNFDKAAQLCLTTLHRQLSFNDYQIKTWAVNGSLLAKFYQENYKFRTARRLLAAAWTMLDRFVHSETSTSSSDESEANLSEARAEVSRRWGMYCVDLLQFSMDSHEGNFDELNGEPVFEEQHLEEAEFPQLELTAHEEQMRCEMAKNFDEAKMLFLSGLKWFTESQSFYTLESFASINTEIAQSISKLYKLLVYFDSSPERRSKLHKRRVDVLSSVLKELNPQYYLQVCRQLDYELGETLSAMVDCKYEIIGSSQASPQQVVKVNQLAKASIEHFEKFLSTFLTSDGEKPKRFPEECERPVLVAYFHMGRLWSKIISGTTEGQIYYTTKSLESYKMLVDYCDSVPESVPLVELELPVSREVVELLPLKIQRIRELSIRN